MQRFPDFASLDPGHARSLHPSVIARPAPAIHRSLETVDARVKPAHDEDGRTLCARRNVPQ